MSRIRTLALCLPLATALMLHYGCSGEESSFGGPGTGGEAAAGTGGGAAHGGGTSSGTGGGGASSSGTGAGTTSSGVGGGGATDAGLDADFAYDAPDFDADLNEDSACAADSVEAAPVPLDIYLMLDRSGSMGSDCNVTWPAPPSVASKWCRSIKVDLTAQAGQIVAAMDNMPYDSGVTPTEAALRGLNQYTAANQTPGRVMIGILITDGDPCCGSCDESNNGLGTIVQNHYDNTGIHTFIIGMDGATFSNLEQWADYNGAIQHDDTNDACGNGGGPCYHYNVGNGDPSVFIWALQQIQNAVLGCTFQIPEPDGGVLDPDQVVVEYLPNGQPPGQELTRVNDANQCVADGWYYDDNNNPTIIQLCPGICGTVEADPSGIIDILLGCQGS